MNDTVAQHACTEYNQLSRRQVVGGISFGAIATALGASWLPKMSFAQSASQRDVIISVYLRGGMDGLAAVVPFGDANYYAIRNNTAVPRPDSSQSRKAINLDGFFGMHPGLGSLMPAWTAGDLLFVHAVGAPNWSRSHFDAQRWMEVGKFNDPNVSTGWLGRHLALTSPRTPTAPLRAMSLTNGMVRTLLGAPKALPVWDPDRFGFTGGFQNEQELSLWIGRAYNRMNDATTAAVRDTRNIVARLDAINFQGYQGQGGAVYPNSSFGYAMKSTAAMMAANLGLEAVHIDKDGWDTHSGQGTIGGDYDNLITDLGNALGAFYRDMAARGNLRWTLVVVSEFGRNAVENGSQGTDHGYGNCMFVMGGGVRGRRVLRQWPGLARHQLIDRQDLAWTIDFRDVLSEIVRKRLLNPNLSQVFPGYSPRFRGVVDMVA
jgi:uncharacterized protein (DUF1501 family)